MSNVTFGQMPEAFRKKVERLWRVAASGFDDHNAARDDLASYHVAAVEAAWREMAVLGFPTATRAMLDRLWLTSITRAALRAKEPTP